MKFSKFLFIVLFLLLFSGAGCLSSNTAKRDGGVYKSLDAGKEWTQTVSYPSLKGVGSLGAIDVETLVMDPSDRKTLYLGTKEDGLFFSYDAGITWQRSQEPFMQSGSIGSLTIDPNHMCTLYVVKGQYIYKSENCSRNFEPIYDETRAGVLPKQIVVDWYHSANVYLALSNGDILKSEDFGQTWTKVFSARKEIIQLLISQKDSRIILAATNSDGIFYSHNAGETWQNTEEALEKFKDADRVYELVQDAKGETILASSLYGLLRSSDQGKTWSRINLVTSPGQVRIYAIALVPNNPQMIYYATSSTFYKTIDGGETWDTRKLPTSRSAAKLLIDPEQTEVLYLGIKQLEEEKKGL